MIPNYLTTTLNQLPQLAIPRSQQSSQDQNQPQAQQPQSENFFPVQSLINNNSNASTSMSRSDTPDRSSNLIIIGPVPEPSLNNNRGPVNPNNNLNYHQMSRIPNIQSLTPYQFFSPTPPPSLSPTPPPAALNQVNPQAQLPQHQKKARFNRIQNFNAVNIRGTVPVNTNNKNYPQPIIPNAIPIISASSKPVPIGAQVLPNPQSLNMNIGVINSHNPALNSAMLPTQFPLPSRVIPFDGNANNNNNNSNKAMIININGIHNNLSKPLMPQSIPLTASTVVDSTGSGIISNVNSNYNMNINPINMNLNKNINMNFPMSIASPTSNRRLPVPEIQIPRETETEIPSQSPSYFRDPESGDYGMHCVCGKSHTDGLLLQCEHCELWLHGMCVNVPRSPTDPYFCPFCLGQRIKCTCDSNMDYSIPLIRCSKCKFWFHKECQELYFGVVPKTFICTKCNGGDRIFYDFPRVIFDEDYPDRKILTENVQHTKLLETIPEGNLKNEIINDLNYPELEFKSTIEKYYQKFAVLLFDGPHEFWKVFINSLCSLLTCEKAELLNAIDHLTTKFLYTDKLIPMTNVKFSHSDSITEQLEQKNMTRFEKPPDDIEIYIDEKDGKVKTPVSIDDGSFIIDLPGFIMRTDDVNADKGIPKSCLVVANSEIVVDLNGTPLCKYATSIRRSFHFNAIAKLIRVKGEAIAALFATRMKGPLSEEKNRRGPAIPEGGEIILPFDGEIPYNVQKIEWKEKKARYNANNVNGRNNQNYNSLPANNISFSVMSTTTDQQQDINNSSNENQGQGYIDESLQNKNDDDYDDNDQQLNDQEGNEKSYGWQKPKKERKRDRRKRKQKGRASQKNKSTYSSNNGKDKSNNNINSDEMSLSLLSSFMSDVVPPMPFILLPDQNAVDKYKMLQMVKSHSRHT